MKILFEKLITESGENLTKRKLAKEMAEAGLFNNLRTAEVTIQNHIHGRSKYVRWDLIKWLAFRFNRKGTDIIQWDEPAIENVAPLIRNDAPGLINK
jgi:hypothetical protein